jgi:hypothetical protein
MGGRIIIIIIISDDDYDSGAHTTLWGSHTRGIELDVGEREMNEGILLLSWEVIMVILMMWAHTTPWGSYLSYPRH